MEERGGCVMSTEKSAHVQKSALQNLAVLFMLPSVSEHLDLSRLCLWLVTALIGEKKK